MLFVNVLVAGLMLWVFCFAGGGLALLLILMGVLCCVAVVFTWWVACSLLLVLNADLADLGLIIVLLYFGWVGWVLLLGFIVFVFIYCALVVGGYAVYLFVYVYYV